MKSKNLQLTFEVKRIYILKQYTHKKFNQKAWLKSQIDMNTELRKKLFGKRFFKLIKYSVFFPVDGRVSDNTCCQPEKYQFQNIR